MYDLDKVLNFARYGIMAEHVDCLLDFSKSATCEVIVRNPFIDAARREIIDGARRDEDVRNKSPIAVTPIAYYQPVIITPVSISQQPPPSTHITTLQTLTTTTTTTSTPAARPPRATCNFCGKSFGHLGDYNKHRRRHTGERPYACDSCPRRFAHASNLQRHRRLHSGEKPFECVTCAKRFSRKDKLAAHVARRCCKPSTAVANASQT